MKKNQNNLPAFTIIEVLITLFIISLGLIGIISLIVQNISSQDYNRGNLIAYQMSQEGVELIRRVRDTNWVALNSFNNNLAPAVGTIYEYCLDYNDDIPALAPSGEPCVLRKGVDGFYAHESSVGSTDSGFSRLVSVELLNSHEMRVISAVYWSDRGRDYSYKVESLLYDWK